jgi:hypothetical protein
VHEIIPVLETKDPELQRRDLMIRLRMLNM